MKIKTLIAVASILLIGTGCAMTPEDEERFRRTGTYMYGYPDLATTALPYIPSTQRYHIPSTRERNESLRRKWRHDAEYMHRSNVDQYIQEQRSQWYQNRY